MIEKKSTSPGEQGSNKDGFENLNQDRQLHDRRTAHFAQRRMFMQFFAVRDSAIIRDFFN
jgi:hypothetical protein